MLGTYFLNIQTIMNIVEQQKKKYVELAIYNTQEIIRKYYETNLH